MMRPWRRLALPMGVGLSLAGCLKQDEPEEPRLGYYESTTRAREALLAGALAADLDGDGRDEYSRTLDGDGRVLTEQIDLDGDGRPELVWDLRAEVKTFRLDTDHDDVPERAIDVRFDAQRPEVASYVVLEDTTQNGVPDQRTSYTIDPALPEFEIELERDADESGQFGESERTLVPLGAQQVGNMRAPQVQTNPDLPGYCNPELAAQLQEELKAALNEGLACLASVSMPATAEAVRALSVAPIELRCVEDRPGVCASAHPETMLQLFDVRGQRPVPVLPIDINLNQEDGCGPIDRTLFHEVMHYVLGPHRFPSILAPLDRGDRVYGCERMCYGCLGDDCAMPVHHAACAQCLGTTEPDPRCDDLEPVRDDRDNEGQGGAGGGGGTGGEDGSGAKNGAGAAPGVGAAGKGTGAGTGSNPNTAPPCVGDAEFCEPFDSSPVSPWGGSSSVPGGGKKGAGGMPSNGRPPRSWSDILSDALAALKGAIFGEPHLITLDGVMYDFQAVGEFVLLESNDLMVQVRQQPFVSSESVAVVSALATRLGNARVAFYTGEQPPLRVDGEPVALEAGLTLAAGGSIHHEDGNYTLVWPDGSELAVRVTRHMLDLVLSLPRGRAGAVSGLLGNANGNTEDEFALRDGTPLPRPRSHAELYGEFAGAWRISAAESLFDYAPGTSTETFTDPAFPRHHSSAGLLSASEYAAGLRACAENGVRGAGVLDACVLDYALSRDPAIVRGYQGMPAPVLTAALNHYRNDFEGAHDGALSSPALARTGASALIADNGFAGPFAPGEISITLPELPDHELVTVAFDLYALGPWDATAFELSVVDGPTLLATTFSNTDTPQAFPDFSGVATHPAQSGAALSGALGVAGFARDALYHQRFTFPHSRGSLTLRFNLPAAADSSVRFGLDNFELSLAAAPGAEAETIDGTLVVHGAEGEPAVIGCADGRREALLDLDRHPDIAGCLASWPDVVSLRAPTTATACGDGLGPCNVPADACAAGWHVCADTGSLEELLRLSPDECENAGGGRYSSAISHCGSQEGCDYADSPEDRYECYPSGWCSEAVCCGSACRARGSCQSGVWPQRTRITGGTSEGCGAVSSVRAGGVLCCR